MIKLNHKKLDVWKVSIEMSISIYRLTQNFPQHELYGLVSQLRRAAISVCSNLSEGSARSSKKERNRFYEIARSSIVEIDTQLLIARKLSYIKESDLLEVSELLNKTFAMNSNLIRRNYKD